MYHLPLLIAFSVRQRTAFVWGGVVMLRMEELPRDEGGTRHDKYGILEVRTNTVGADYASF